MSQDAQQQPDPAAQEGDAPYAQEEYAPYAQPGQAPYAQPAYAQPAYAAYAQPGYAQPAPVPPTNTLSIFALVSAFVLPFVVPIVLGHLSLSQIRRTGEGGRGLALAGLIIGYVELGIWAMVILFVILGLAVAANASF